MKENKEEELQKISFWHTKLGKLIGYIYSFLKETALSDKLVMIALALSLVAFFRDCCQDKRIESTQYNISQNENRANIKITSLEIQDVKLIFNDSSFRATNIEDFLEKDSNVIKDIKGTLEFSLHLYATNIGNSRAKIFAEFYTDTTSGERFLEKIINEQRNESPSKIITDYYSESEINPNDTIVLKRFFKIQNIKDNMFTLHILLFYENELEQLFDTYFWTRFRTRDVRVRKVLIPSGNENIVSTQVNTEDIQKMIDFVDSNSTSRMYTKAQAKKMRKRIIKLLTDM